MFNASGMYMIFIRVKHDVYRTEYERIWTQYETREN